jgi:hypothetical protein
MPSATKAYAALTEAMHESVPSCLGDDRFTSEDADPVPLIKVCAGCPLYAQCRALTVASNCGPVWGVVGGLVRRPDNPSTGSGPQKKLDGIYG